MIEFIACENKSFLRQLLERADVRWHSHARVYNVGLLVLLGKVTFEYHVTHIIKLLSQLHPHSLCT